MTQNSFGRNFKAIREGNSLTQQQIADAIGVTVTTIGAWETRGKSPKQRSVVDRICELYDVTEQDLFGFSDGFYAKQYGLSGQVAEPVAMTATAPVLGRIAAGDPREALEMSGEEHSLPDTLKAKYPDGFFLVVRGDSMNLVLPDGCYAFIIPEADRPVTSGDIAAVKVNGDEATVKRVKMVDGVIILEPESSNPAHKRRVIDSEDPDAPYVRMLGKVGWFDYSFIEL